MVSGGIRTQALSGPSLIRKAYAISDGFWPILLVLLETWSGRSENLVQNITAAAVIHNSHGCSTLIPCTPPQFPVRHKLSLQETPISQLQELIVCGIV